MTLTESYLSATDGTRLFVRRFDAGDSAARTLVIVHGACEHGGRYEHVAGVAVERGWNVVIADLRGHGRSEGVPVHVMSFEQYLADLDLVFNEFALAPDDTALLGHSMGGLIAIRYVETRPERVRALVAASPLLGFAMPVPLWKRIPGRLLATFVPRTRFASLVDPAGLTHDEECLARRKVDPFMHKSVTARWFFAVQRAIRQAHDEATSVKLPLLMLHGSIDPVTDPRAALQWFESAGSHDKTFEYVPDHLHELFNEPDWQRTLDLTLDWFDHRVPKK